MVDKGSFFLACSQALAPVASETAFRRHLELYVAAVLGRRNAHGESRVVIRIGAIVGEFIGGVGIVPAIDAASQVVGRLYDRSHGRHLQCGSNGIGLQTDGFILRRGDLGVDLQYDFASRGTHSVERIHSRLQVIDGNATISGDIYVVRSLDDLSATIVSAAFHEFAHIRIKGKAIGDRNHGINDLHLILGHLGEVYFYSVYCRGQHDLYGFFGLVALRTRPIVEVLIAGDGKSC